MYLALPFVFDKVTKSSLQKVNIKSSLSTTLLRKSQSIELRNSLALKNHQVEQYHEFTNRGIIFLGNVQKLEIGQYVLVQNAADFKLEKTGCREYCRAAYYLGVLLAKEDYRNVFVKLGITNI